MSKEANLKNQNKLKVYLEKTKKDGIKLIKNNINGKKMRSI